MYEIYANWQCTDNPSLMSWVLPDNGDFNNAKQPSATDGDMDIAYALILADNQWGGGPNGFSKTYLELAADIIFALIENNVYTADDLGISNPDNAKHFPRLGIGDNNTSKDYWRYSQDWTNNIQTFTGISDESNGAYDNKYYWNSCCFPWRFSTGWIYDNSYQAELNILWDHVKNFDYELS